MVARIVAVAVLVSAVLAAPASAAQLRPFHGLSANGGPIADGKRWVAYIDLAGDTIVVDEKRGTRVRIGALPNCNGQSPTAVGSGRVVFVCPETPDARIVRATDGSPVGRISLLPTKYNEDADGVFVTAIGSRWVELGISGYHWSKRYLANWRLQSAGIDEDWSGANAVPSLNATAPTQTMCSPLHRSPPADQPDAYISGPAYVDYQYDYPWGLTTRGKDYGLWLEHCDTAKAIKLCSKCYTGRLGAGYATWAESGSAYALRLRDRHLFRFKMATAERTDQAGRTLFAFGSMPDSGAHTFVGTLPR